MVYSTLPLVAFRTSSPCWVSLILILYFLVIDETTLGINMENAQYSTYFVCFYDVREMSTSCIHQINKLSLEKSRLNLCFSCQWFFPSVASGFCLLMIMKTTKTSFWFIMHIFFLSLQIIKWSFNLKTLNKKVFKALSKQPIVLWCTQS